MGVSLGPVISVSEMKKIISFFDTLTWWQWIILWGAMLAVFGATGIALGYSSGLQERQKSLAFARAVDLQLQVELGVADLDAGNYDLARQRFEYVLGQDPGFPGITDRLAETLLRIAETSTQEVALPTPTPAPTPTPDTRTIDELFSTAQRQYQNREWKNLIQTISALRDIDPLYQVSLTDRMLYVALRMAGVQKILEDGDLEGGMYDLSLVGKFVPLDSQASVYREWANLYQLGVSFWGIFPEKAVAYFSQIANIAPYLRDLSGIFAKDRYRMALAQYGDRLAEQGDWCLALEQYALAQNLFDDQALLPTAAFAGEQCHGAAPTVQSPSPEAATPTTTMTPEATATQQVTPDVVIPTPTGTSTLEPTPEVEMTPTPESP